MALEPTSTSIADRVGIEIHSGNPREGPGDVASTRRAFSLVKNLPTSPRILDVGCGPGQQSIELAKLSQGVVSALDIHAPFLKELAARAHKEALNGKIIPIHGSMSSITLPDASFELLWSEGAIYIIGFEAGLKQWRRLLVKDGWLVASHLSWLKEEIPTSPRTFWNKNYPAISSVKNNLLIAEAQGYTNEAHFTLPEDGWWREYYNPISEKLESLRKKYYGIQEAERRIADMQEEIDLYREYSDCYGYVFYIMRKK